jgi:hypothetical protein
MSIRLTPQGTFIRKVEFILTIDSASTAGASFSDITTTIDKQVLDGIEAIKQFFTQKRINSFEVAVYNTPPEIQAIMLSDEKLTQIDNTKTKVLLPTTWNLIFEEVDFSDITDEDSGYFYVIRRSMSFDLAFRIEIEFKNMLGCEKIPTGIKDKKFAAVFQKNNILQALLEKERINDKDKLDHHEIQDEEYDELSKKLEKHDKVNLKKKHKVRKEIKYY